MGRERFRGLEVRMPAKLASALAIQREKSEQRKLAREAGHVAIDAGAEQEIVTFPQFRECVDTRSFAHKIALHNTVYNQSVSLDWQQADPKEDYKPDTSNPSRIGPSS